jgi:hypothetical protein
MVSKELYDARIKFVVKGYPIKTRRVIGANAWYRGRQLLRTGRQKCVMTGWNNVNLWFARQDTRDARSSSGIDTLVEIA